METNNEEIVYHAPDKLLVGFTKGKIVVWIAAAVAIHIVFVGMTSIGYIRDRWVDPEGASARKAAAVAKQEKAKAKAPQPVAAAATNQPAAATASSSSTGSEQRLMAERKDTPVVKRITEKADSKDMPKQPGDIGISIEDTNVH